MSTVTFTADGRRRALLLQEVDQKCRDEVAPKPPAVSACIVARCHSAVPGLLSGLARSCLAQGFTSGLARVCPEDRACCDSCCFQCCACSSSCFCAVVRALELPFSFVLTDGS